MKLHMSTNELTDDLKNLEIVQHRTVEIHIPLPGDKFKRTSVLPINIYETKDKTINVCCAGQKVTVDMLD